MQPTAKQACCLLLKTEQEAKGALRPVAWVGEGVVKGLRRASAPFVRLMTAAKAAITFITQKTGSSTALSTPCALPMTLSKTGQLA